MKIDKDNIYLYIEAKPIISPGEIIHRLNKLQHIIYKNGNITILENITGLIKSIYGLMINILLL